MITIPDELFSKAASSHAVNVYLVLLLQARKNAGTTAASFRQLADATDLSTDTVRRALLELEDNGLVEVTREKYKTSVYRLPYLEVRA